MPRFLQPLMILVVAVAMAAIPASGAVLGPALQQSLQTASSTDILRVIVTFDHSPTSLDVSLLQSVAERSQVLDALSMALVEITPAGLATLTATDGIRSLYLDQQLEYYLHESVPLIRADAAWQDLGATGAGVGVAVIDSGIDATHPDLPFGSKVVQNVKIVGVSAEDDPTGAGIIAAIEDVPNSDTTSGHGTHVAGTVAGIGAASHTGTSDDLGGYGYFTGVAPGAHLVGLGTGDTLFIFYALEGFDYAISNRDRYAIKVITNSWGSTMEPGEAFDPDNPINIASKIATDAGMTVLFAAGNSGPGTDTLNRYSVAPWVISVAAGNKDGETLANFSSRGRYGDDAYSPTITAPGVDIVAARAPNTVLPPLAADSDAALPAEWLPYYTTMSGTSMATPHVAGVVALLYEVRNDMSPELAKRLIVNTATPMPLYESYASGAGYVDAYGAVAQAQAIKQIKAYRDPRTGKEIEVYVVETTETGSVGPAVASYNAVLATTSHPLTVSSGSIFLDVKLLWDNYVNDIDLFLYSIDASTGTETLEGASQDIQALSMAGREGVAVDYPSEGDWRADVRGWLNVPQDYTLTTQQYFPLQKGNK